MYLPAFGLLRRQHGLITHAQLLEVVPHRSDVRRLVQSGRLVRVRRGVLADAEVWDSAEPYRARPLLRIRAATLSLQSAAYAFSHDSSSIVLDMGAPSPESALVHISRTKVHGDAVRAGIKHHRAPYLDAEMVEVDGLTVRLAAASRPGQPGCAGFVNDWVSWGAGTRASQYLVLGGKTRALIQGRVHVSFDDIRAMAHPVLRHRVLINYKAEAEGVTVEKVIDRLLEHVQR